MSQYTSIKVVVYFDMGGSQTQHIFLVFTATTFWNMIMAIWINPGCRRGAWTAAFLHAATQFLTYINNPYLSMGRVVLNNWLPCSLRVVKPCKFFLHSRFLSPGGTITLIQSAFGSYKGLEHMSMKRKRTNLRTRNQVRHSLNTTSDFMPDCKESLV